MPAKTGGGSVLKALSGELSKALKATNKNETVMDKGGDLPPDLRGVAQLSKITFGKYENGDLKGKPYFMAQATVKTPEEFKGEQTRIGPIPLCNTPNRTKKLLKDHVDVMLNELRKLGADTSECESDADLEAVCAELVEAAPHFKYRTWKGQKTKAFPDPRTNHVWNGVTEFEDDGAEGAVEDDTDTKEEEGEEAAEEEAEEEAAEEEGEEAAEEEASEESEGETDLDALAEAADGGDEDAQGQLVAMCEPLSIDAEKFKTWALVVKAIRKAAPAEEEAAEEEAEEEAAEEEPAEEEFKPKLKEVYKYQPIDPKTKKPAVNPKTKKAKLVEVEIKAVNPKLKTVDVKNLDDGKMLKGIKWDKLKQD
jgi:hypothetical protein